MGDIVTKQLKSVPGIDHQLACEVELSLTLSLQESQQLLVMKIFYVKSFADAKYSCKMIQSIFTGGWMKLLQFDLYVRKLSMLAIHRRCARDSLKQITDHC